MAEVDRWDEFDLGADGAICDSMAILLDLMIGGARLVAANLNFPCFGCLS